MDLAPELNRGALGATLRAFSCFGPFFRGSGYKSRQPPQGHDPINNTSGASITMDIHGLNKKPTYCRNKSKTNFNNNNKGLFFFFSKSFYPHIFSSLGFKIRFCRGGGARARTTGVSYVEGKNILICPVPLVFIFF